MASRYKHRSPGRYASESIYISGSDNYSIEGEDIVSEEQNNRRLREAISYLATGGGSDALDLYTDRVEKIDNHLLQQYAEEEYLFDPKLYRQLKAMVREVQKDSSKTDEDDMDMLEDSEEVEEREQEALLREREKQDVDESDLEAVARADRQIRKDSAKTAKAKEDAKTAARQKQLAIDRAGKTAVGQPQTPVRTSAQKTTHPTAQRIVQTVTHTSTSKLYDHPAHHGQPQTPIHPGRSAVDKVQKTPREIVWRYGGPKNDPEQYHQKFPASLPFGETLYMQEWESMKIDFDLNASANRKADDPPIITNVDYNKVRLPVGKNPFDSGSRFKLPEEDPRTSKWLKDDKGELLRKAVHDFNQGGNLKAAEGKDYAPRIWLPKIIVGKQEPFFHARPRDASLDSRISRDVPSKPTSSATKPSRSRTAGASDVQTNKPLVNTTAEKSKSLKQARTVAGTGIRSQPVPSIQDATTTGRRKAQIPTRVDSAHDEREDIYAKYRQAKARQIRSSPNKIDSRRNINPIVRVQTSKHLPPVISPQTGVKRGPGRPRKASPPDAPPKSTKSPPNARVIEKPHPSDANTAPRSTKRKLSDGSKRFTPGKKVFFNEDDNEEFSADEGVVKKVAKKAKKAVVREELKSPSHTRSGKRFLPSLVQ